jgi:hypothetical protein
VTKQKSWKNEKMNPTGYIDDLLVTPVVLADYVQKLGTQALALERRED